MVVSKGVVLSLLINNIGADVLLELDKALPTTCVVGLYSYIVSLKVTVHVPFLLSTIPYASLSTQDCQLVTG